MQCDTCTDLHEYALPCEFVFDVRYILFYSVLSLVKCICIRYAGKFKNENVALLVPEGCTSSKLPARLDGEVFFNRTNAM